MCASDIDRKCTRAVGDACRQLNERLAPYKQSMKGAKFEEIVRTAHMDRIDLSAHGWYITPDITGEPSVRALLCQWPVHVVCGYSPSLYMLWRRLQTLLGLCWYTLAGR